MSIPVSLIQLLFFAIALLPGLTFASIKRYCIGQVDLDLSAAARTLDALYVSLLFMVLYTSVALMIVQGDIADFPANASKAFNDLNPWCRGTLVVVATVVLPAVIAGFRYRGLGLSHRFPWITRNAISRTNDPRAWEGAADFAVTGRFVRVQMEDGRYFGGWYGASSRMGLFPHGRDLFLEVQWVMKEDGSFLQPLEGAQGIWLPVTDSVVVEWLEAPDPEGRSDE